VFCTLRAFLLVTGLVAEPFLPPSRSPCFQERVFSICFFPWSDCLFGGVAPRREIVFSFLYIFQMFLPRPCLTLESSFRPPPLGALFLGREIDQGSLGNSEASVLLRTSDSRFSGMLFSPMRFTYCPVPRRPGLSRPFPSSRLFFGLVAPPFLFFSRFFSSIRAPIVMFGFGAMSPFGWLLAPSCAVFFV